VKLIQKMKQERSLFTSC